MVGGRGPPDVAEVHAAQGILALMSINRTILVSGRTGAGVSSKYILAVGGRAVGGRTVGNRDVGGRAVGGLAVGGRAVGGRAVGWRAVGGAGVWGRYPGVRVPPGPRYRISPEGKFTSGIGGRESLAHRSGSEGPRRRDARVVVGSSSSLLSESWAAAQDSMGEDAQTGRKVVIGMGMGWEGLSRGSRKVVVV
jgi:hypothetical protein